MTLEVDLERVKNAVSGVNEALQAYTESGVDARAVEGWQTPSKWGVEPGAKLFGGHYAGLYSEVTTNIRLTIEAIDDLVSKVSEGTKRLATVADDQAEAFSADLADAFFSSAPAPSPTGPVPSPAGRGFGVPEEG